MFQPQTLQRLVSRSGRDGGVGVVRSSRAAGGAGLRLLASHALASTRRKLIGDFSCPQVTHNRTAGSRFTPIATQPTAVALQTAGSGRRDDALA